MSTPFVSQLRSRPETIVIGEGGPVISVRVQVPEVWDVVRIDAPKDTPVSVLRDRALQVLVADPDGAAYVVKLRGLEVLDESASLEAAGVENGSTLLVTSRRRRPVK